ncbi:MAG: EthD family reductase [Betaproteobacteria bacterium]|nr:EthD family reductase [Betaproteobacteria bacterium]
MVKMVIFFKRKSGMSVEAFQDHWRRTHAAIIVRLPGIRRYVQSHVLPSSYRKGEPVFDAVAESSFDDTQAMKLLSGSPQYAEVLADEPNFIERSSMNSIITDEHVIKDAPAPANGIKSIDFVTHKPGMPIDEFRAYWREVHGPLCAAIPAVRRYVQNPTRRSIYDSGRTPAFDGAAMTWFDSMDALRAAAPTPEFARLRDDVEKFVARDASPFVLTQEHVILA